MKILVANLGSTSFKYRLFDMATETQLAKGGIDRIGQPESRCVVEIGETKQETLESIPNHAVAVGKCLDQLTDPETGCLSSVKDVAAIGFKAVFAGKLSGVRIVSEELLTKMEALADIAPAHNPPYARAMRELKSAFPEIPLVAALETGFHETIPKAHRVYAVPYEWKDQYEVQRWGFHGASHRFIATRTADLLGGMDKKIISCHLGGSSSICAIQNGKSVATSLGMSPQSGLPHNNRVGDFDAFALQKLLQAGQDLDTIFRRLGKEGGLLGISGVSPDMREVQQAAAEGNERARLAVDAFVETCRGYVGSYLVALGGADAVVFTGGIGQHDADIRGRILDGLSFAGILPDESRNAPVDGNEEHRISLPDSPTEIWVLPTNEELIVARQTHDVLTK